MNFIRAKLFMILCLAVVVLGIMIFLIGNLVAAGNKTEREKIQQICQEVDILAGKTVHENVIAKINENISLIDEDRKETLNLIKKTTARPLLYPEVFEEDISVADLYVHYGRFAERYCLAVEDLINRLNGGDKLNEAEEEKIRLDYLQKTGSVISDPSGGVFGTAVGVEQGRINKTIEGKRKDRAESIAIYATTNAFCCLSHWQARPSDERAKMIPEIWYTQIAYWIQEDVVGAIKQINDNSNSVFNSPVKRLLGIAFGGQAPESVTTLASASARGAVASSIGTTASEEFQTILPCYVISSSSAAAGQGVDPTMSSTEPAGLGYVESEIGYIESEPTAITASIKIEGGMTRSKPEFFSDNLVNVVHFEIIVVIDSSEIHNFINTLQSEERYTWQTQPDGGTIRENRRNQMTVLQMQIDPIYIAAENQQGYYYGSASVKRLRLTCQYIFFRSGYDEVIPSAIKALLPSFSDGG